MKFSKIIYLYFSIVLFTACGFYSFTGASISDDVKTVTVDYFPNHAATIEPTLSQYFTEKLRDYLLEQTNLNLDSETGDLNFSGSIIKYEIKPIAIQSNEQAAQNRLTIAVKVKFNNAKDESTNFEQQFSRYSDYNSSQSLLEVESALIEQITTELIEDIFNKALVNW